MRLAATLSLLAAMAVATAATAAGYQVEYAFQGGADGAYPLSRLLKFHGNLYGTTSLGAGGEGDVYTLDPNTGTQTVVYTFNGSGDGARPNGGLTNVGGEFYGTTLEGGPGLYGTVFSLDPATGGEQVVYSFNYADGASPVGGLTKVRGILYGVNSYGGGGGCSAGCGTVFSYDPKTGAEAVVYTFQGGTDGMSPTGDLIEVGGLLLGTTTYGGPSQCYQGCGTVFRVDPTTGAETVLHAFVGGADGAFPQGGLTMIGGTLYGTTTAGGVSCGDAGCGTVFALEPHTGAENVVYAFKGGVVDGVFPLGLMANENGLLFGVTEFGGSARGLGTVFSLNPATGAEMELHAFRGRDDGASPRVGLIYAGDRLYGTTYLGGSGPCKSSGPRGCGTVFSIRP